MVGGFVGAVFFSGLTNSIGDNELAPWGFHQMTKSAANGVGLSHCLKPFSTFVVVIICPLVSLNDWLLYAVVLFSNFKFCNLLFRSYDSRFGLRLGTCPRPWKCEKHHPVTPHGCLGHSDSPPSAGWCLNGSPEAKIKGVNPFTNPTTPG